MSKENIDPKILTKQELTKYVHNPAMVQKKILDLITEYDGKEVGITNATSPFNMLLEATAVTAANALSESINLTRRIYPDLALTRKDISHLISDDELKGITSYPGSVDLTFKISVTDMLSHGVRPAGSKYVEFTIPEMSKVTVYNTDLTILNDIVIKFYDNGVSFVEQLVSDNPISIKDVGIIPSAIETDEHGHLFLYFATRVQQLTVTNYSYGVIAGDGFTKSLELKAQDNKFHYIKVGYANAGTNKQIVNLPIRYDDSFLDPQTPCAYVNVIDNDVTDKLIVEAVKVHIPDSYFIHNNVSGTISVELYETKGAIYMPLNQTPMSEFKLKLGNVGKNVSTSVSRDIHILIGSDGVIANGSNGLTFEELRKAIIYNTKGEQNIPITDHHLSYNNILDGFQVMKDHDIITNRVYVAMKNIYKERTETLRCYQDVYFNTVAIILEDYLHHPKVLVFSKTYIIKAGAIFKKENGYVTLVKGVELDKINTMQDVEKIQFYKDNKYFITPYYYYVDRFEKHTTARIYDLDRPKLSGMKIIANNQSLKERANSVAWALFRKTTDTFSGYELVVRIVKNEDLKKIPVNEIHMGLALDLITDNKVYLEAKYDAKDDVYRFDIESNYEIDQKDNIRINNGESLTANKWVPLTNVGSLYIYTTSSSVNDPDSFLVNELPINKRHVIFNKEYININFGYRLNSIWSKIATSYTERKYKRYSSDVMAYYEESVLEKDPVSGMTLRNKGGKLVVVPIHKKGEKVLDKEGNHVVKHHQGDVVIGENGLPVIDDLGGIERHIDICMLDHEFYAASNEVYKKHSQMAIDQINEYVMNVLPSRNNKLLENTFLYYKSYKSVLPIKVKINNTLYAVDSLVSPEVTLYLNQNDKFQLTEKKLKELTDRIGYTIDKHLERETISLAVIREEIKNDVGDNIVSVKITGIDAKNSELILLEDKNTRLGVKKILVPNDYNKLDVAYDVNVIIQTL